MISSESFFYGLSDIECEAVTMTEGVIFVCVLKSSLNNCIKKHIRFLTEVQQIPQEEISSSTSTLRNYRYTVIPISSLSSFRELIEMSVASQKKGLNLYCVGAASEWKLLCKNIPIAVSADDVRPNIVIDCTEHNPDFYQPMSTKEIVNARMQIIDILSALASRKPPILLFAETEQDYNYVDLFKAQYGSKDIIYLNKTPNDSATLNASKVITIRNSGNQESIDGLLNYVEGLQSVVNVHVILYSFYKRNRILESKLDNLEVSYDIIIPNENIGIPSISTIALDVKQQILKAIGGRVHE